MKKGVRVRDGKSALVALLLLGLASCASPVSSESPASSPTIYRPRAPIVYPLPR